MIATVPYVTAMSIKPDYSVVYNKYIGDGYCKRGTIKSSLDNLGQNQSKGLISKKAKSKIIDRLSWFHKLSKVKKVQSNKNGKYWQFKLSMITLTLSSQQVHSDTVIKRQLLNNFIIKLKRDEKIKTYIWRAEAQKNGNIHFHIIIDKWIDHQTIRQIWNTCQNKLHYVDNCTASVNPNSTDIHSLRGIGNVLRYMAKYCTKNNTKYRQIEGKLWGCSEDLMNIGSIESLLSHNEESELRSFEKNNPEKIYRAERCTIVKLPVNELIKVFPFLFNQVKSYILNSFHNFVKKTKIKIIESWTEFIEKSQALRLLKSLNGQLLLSLQ